MITSLICEGKCNPTFGSVEADLRAFRRSPDGQPWPLHDGDVSRPGGMPIPPDALLTRLRRLRHTPHTFVAARPDPPVGKGQLWQCVDCGQVRMWGHTGDDQRPLAQARHTRSLSSITPA